MSDQSRVYSPQAAPTSLYLSSTVEVPAGARSVTLEGVRLSPGPGRVEAFVTEGDESRGVMFVELSRR